MIWMLPASITKVPIGRLRRMPIFDVCWRSFLKKLFTTAAVMVAFGNVAYGADFAFKAPIVASLYDWTGFYAGGTVGGAVSWGGVRGGRCVDLL